MIQADTFRRHVLASGTFDPDGVHHEFANDSHGRKLDFDIIPDNSPLYGEWVELNGQVIRAGERSVIAVVGVANGTNRLARDVAAALGTRALYTRKASPREVQLTAQSREWLLRHAGKGGLVIILEDVGTTGGTALTAAESARQAGAREVEAQFTWQRTDNLAAFDRASIPYISVIHESLPTYAPDQCAREGYCAKGWRLIPHAKV